MTIVAKYWLSAGFDHPLWQCTGCYLVNQHSVLAQFLVGPGDFEQEAQEVCQQSASCHVIQFLLLQCPITERRLAIFTCKPRCMSHTMDHSNWGLTESSLATSHHLLPHQNSKKVYNTCKVTKSLAFNWPAVSKVDQLVYCVAGVHIQPTTYTSCTNQTAVPSRQHKQGIQQQKCNPSCSPRNMCQPTCSGAEERLQTSNQDV